MKRSEYLQSLEHALRANRVEDIEDILAEYRQHFDFKTADGYTEEEVAARLEKPERIAALFANADGGLPRKKGRAVLIAGLSLADVFVTLFFIVLFGGVIALGVFSLTLAILGVCLIAGQNIAGLIPPVPYVPALVTGISFAAMAVFSGIGTLSCWLNFAQLIRAYLRWHKNTLSSGNYPPLTTYATLSNAFRRRLRTVSLVAFVIFGFCFVAGLFLLFAAAGFQPFWHAWHWFI